MDSSKRAKKGIMIVAAVILAIAGIAIIQGRETPEKKNKGTLVNRKIDLLLRNLYPAVGG